MASRAAIVRLGFQPAVVVLAIVYPVAELGVFAMPTRRRIDAGA